MSRTTVRDAITMLGMNLLDATDRLQSAERGSSEHTSALAAVQCYQQAQMFLHGNGEHSDDLAVIAACIQRAVNRTERLHILLNEGFQRQQCLSPTNDVDYDFVRACFQCYHEIAVMLRHQLGLIQAEAEQIAAAQINAAAN